MKLFKCKGEGKVDIGAYLSGPFEKSFTVPIIFKGKTAGEMFFEMCLTKR